MKLERERERGLGGLMEHTGGLSATKESNRVGRN